MEWNTNDDMTTDQEILRLPPSIREEWATGTDINLRSDQLQVLDYWAQAAQTAFVGISFKADNYQVEYWLPIQLQPLADEPLANYITQLQNQSQAELATIARMITQFLVGVEIQYVFKMRSKHGTLRVWFAPKDQFDGGVRPLAEASVPEDRWVAQEVEVLPYPPMPEEHVEASAHMLFEGKIQGHRHPNPEIPGGNIALIVQNNMPEATEFFG
jgi:hypothetical protein